MSERLQEILAYNQTFVENKEYEPFKTTKYPDKKIVVLSCMDTRLMELLPKAMNLRNGDAKIIKSAGAVVSQPFGAIMRSIIIAVYTLKAEEIYVVGHTECGMTGMNPEPILQSAVERGVSEEALKTLFNSGINLNKWLTGFSHVRDGVIGSVEKIRNHPLLPPNIPVHGLIIDSETGKIEVVVDGSNK